MTHQFSTSSSSVSSFSICSTSVSSCSINLRPELLVQVSVACAVSFNYVFLSRLEATSCTRNICDVEKCCQAARYENIDNI